LRLILACASRTVREGALGDHSCNGGTTNFRAIPISTQPDNLAGPVCLGQNPVYPKQADSKFRNSGQFDSWHRHEEYRKRKGATAMLRPLILLLALSSVPFAQDISRAQGDETKIIAFENLWNQMQINHEADAMGKMLDSDFVLTDYDGTVMSKGQFLASIRDKSTQLNVEVSEDMKLHRHGDTVIVTGSTHEKGTEKGKPFSHQGRFTDTWIKKDGQWLCVASQLSLLNK
jgi:ketosteroid isomerase-like protein